MGNIPASNEEREGSVSSIVGEGEGRVGSGGHSAGEGTGTRGEHIKKSKFSGNKTLSITCTTPLLAETMS